MPKKNPEKDPNDPSETSFAWDLMAPRWHKMETLLGGTETMRVAGEIYTPRHEEESTGAYEERLLAANLFNLTELTLDALVGRPFSDPVELSEDMPSNIKELAEGDLDLQGNNIDVVARNWFRDGLAKSFSHVLVDFPRVDTEAELGRPRTVADDQKEGVRPYWVHVKPENLIFAAAAIIDSHEVLIHVRIQETTTEQVGFTEREVEKIRVYDAGFTGPEGEIIPTHVRLFRKLEKKKVVNKKKIEWELEDEWDLGISFIPLVTFYSDRDSFMVGKPPLTDLADANITHWQSGSDQRATLTVARFPILAASGAVDADRLKVGPKAWLNMPDPSGKFYYVEHEGHALAAGREDMKDLVGQMCQYGAEFLKKRPDRETLGARALDSAEATSPLQDMTTRFIDAMNTALKFTAAWLKQEESGTVKISTDFGPEEADEGDLSQLQFARTNRDLSHPKYLAELQRRAVLPDEFDIKENDRELEDESMAFGPPAEDIDPEANIKKEEEDESA